MHVLGKRTLRVASLATSVTLGAGLAVGVAPMAAHADPGCVNDGAYVLFARGSGEGFNDVRANEFYWRFVGTSENPGRLMQLGVTSAWAELGNLDNNWSVDPQYEYPAVPVFWRFPEYNNSVTIGVNELVAHLNDRAVRCPTETTILGGYSQGADVIGTALARTGYGSLSATARNHIGSVALYGDPRYLGNFGSLFGNCYQPPWAIIAESCPLVSNVGFLGARSPYVPADLWSRVSSYCDNGDGVCHGSIVYGLLGTHTTAYDGTWIAASAQRVVAIAISKRNQLTPSLPPAPGAQAPASGSPPLSLPTAPTPTQGPGVGTASYLGSDTLAVNQPLYRGQYIMTPEGNFVLYFQSDGNLVLYGHTFQPIWASYTGGGSGAFVVLQPDGNWVMYSGSGQPVWYNGANGTTGNRVVVQPDGNLVEYNPYGQAVWNTATSRAVPAVSYFGADHLNAGQSLNQRQYLRSGNGSGTRFLLLQEDGNLVLYGPGYHYLWNSGTGGTGACHLDMQPDGNLVLYTPAGQAVWSSGTSGTGATHADVQPDGNFVIYSAAGQAVWWSGTAGQGFF